MPAVESRIGATATGSIRRRTAHTYLRTHYGLTTDSLRTHYNGTMSGAPNRAASAVRSSGCRCDSRSASTRFS
jgi:hypothetical protein